MKVNPLFSGQRANLVKYLSVWSILVFQASTAGARAYQLELQPQQAKQGEPVRVILREEKRNSSPANGTPVSTPPPVVQFQDKTYQTFLLGETKVENSPQSAERAWRLLLGIPADIAPGTYTIKCGDIQKELKVVEAGYGVQSIRLPKSKDNFDGSPGEVEATDKAKSTVSPHQYWQGKFLRPSTARQSSPFGLRRRVNGVLLSDYFHSGLDFAGAAGSPVLASQSGKVLIAHLGWKLHGNTICLDHGQGVVSFYIHLSRIYVKEGQIVRAGQKIGAIGSTGRASGPHLHFSIYANQNATNPLNWFRNNY